MSRLRRTWLTRETYDRLHRELAALLDGGAGSEEPEFAYVPDEEARRARISRIREILEGAVVGVSPPDDGVAEPGMVLTVRYEGDEETETFLLGVRDGSAGEGMAVYSPESPLGSALVGARQGERCSYKAPNGKTIRVTLVEATPYDGHRSGRVP